MDDDRDAPPAPVETPSQDPVEAAKDAGLRYVSDESPGIRRIKRGRGVAYVSPGGKVIKDEQSLARIRSLAIPPAYTDVWICPLSNGHLQATGRDARGRKQYRYHPKWRENRDSTKYDRMIAFAHALPRIRRRVQRDLKLPGLPREKVLAAVVRLLETTLIRVGNDEYAKQNGSFGLTTMRDKHADINGHSVRFTFHGKHGIEHAIDLTDKHLVSIIKRCQDLPGYELFQYEDDEGDVGDVGSADVNEYLREISGQEFTAKDFRTWAGTVLAAMALRELEGFKSQTQAKKNIVAAIESVAKKLGNTKAVCRKCYVHPVVLDAYLDGTLVKTLRRKIEKKFARDLKDLRPEEAAVMGLLLGRLKGSGRTRRTGDVRHPGPSRLQSQP